MLKWFLIVTLLIKPNLSHRAHCDNIRYALCEQNDELDQIKRKLSRNNLESEISNFQTMVEKTELTLKKAMNNLMYVNLPRDCKEVQDRGHNESDIHFIQPKLSREPFLVLCDLITRGGGWTHILKRTDGSQNFDQDWKNYKVGFGQLRGEFWLGLDNIHYLTGHNLNELLVELVDWESNKAYANYQYFSVSNEKLGYSLNLLEGYSGDAGDSFSYNSGMKFTTRDVDNDLWKKNCANVTKAGWWFRDCSYTLLTGKYLEKNSDARSDNGIYWDGFRGEGYGLKEVRIMVRPRNYYLT